MDKFETLKKLCWGYMSEMESIIEQSGTSFGYPTPLSQFYKLGKTIQRFQEEIYNLEKEE